MSKRLGVWACLGGIVSVMPFAVAFIATLFVLALARKGRELKTQGKPKGVSASATTETVVERQRKQQETDELITVIIPTINHDK